ncbi:MAG: MarR family transcriptional regulator [Actinobacteria bacterium]|nr:MarR family transcriptional regulator [Actinomycetota bacterium]
MIDERLGEHSPVEVAKAVRRLDVALAEMHLEVSREMNMTGGELLALEYLGIEGPLGPTALAQRLHMGTGATTALLDRLEEQGRIARRTHESDRRKIVVQITAHGRDEVMARAHPMVDEVIAMVQGLPADERPVIHGFLEDLTALVGRHAGPRPSADGSAAASAQAEQD